MRKPPSPQIVHPFDTQYGVDTSGMITAVNLLSGHAHDLLGTGYCGVAPSRFRNVMQRWIDTPPEHPVSAYSFVDIGCGKGRALMLATSHPFADICGVELNPALAETAKTNLEKWRSLQHPVSPTHVVCGDATEFVFPERPCLIYLYNPFADPILKLLLDRIERSFRANPRPLDILYCNPTSNTALAQHRSFLQLWSDPISISEEDVAANPSAGSAEICSLYRRIAR